MSRVLIVGGVAGGASTAARLRRLDEHAEIVVFERGEHVSYANCGLPYYAGGVIKERDRLFVMTPEKFRGWLAVEVRTGTEIVSIDRARKVVVAMERATGRTREEAYDRLVLSPGAEPLRPPVPGLDLEGVFTLRSVSDVDRIKAWLDARNPERATVVGGGFIGLEMAENLSHRGIAVTVAEAQGQVMNVLDPDMASLIHAQLRAKGVELALGAAVRSFERRNGRLVVTLASGKEIDSDLVVLSVGVRPDTDFARKSGIACAPSGAILVDAAMRTSDPDIFALGDAVEVQSPVLGRGVHIPLAGPATKQARIVAENLILSLKDPVAEGRPYGGALGTSIAKVFDIVAAATGANEKTLRNAGIVFETVVIHASSHAGYYPDALPISLKVLFDPASGRLLGAQAVGYDGVDKRMDLLAETLRRKGTVSDLAEIEHAYAPPFSSSKDPVNILGMAGDNVCSGLTRVAHWNEVDAWRARGAFLLDVRTREEFALGSIPGALNIPNDEVRERLQEIPRDRPVFIFCGVGLRGYLVERILRQSGWSDVANLTGGYKTWASVMAGQTEPAGLRNEPPRKALDEQAAVIKVDVCGLQCPGPIMRLKLEMDRVPEGTRIALSATDPGFAGDVASWCRVTGNFLHGVEEAKGVLTATVEKRSEGQASPAEPAGTKGATFIVFSDNLDRALASFILANGAAASGKATTLFFTFWGLSVLKRREKPDLRKDWMGRMFGWMLPAHPGRLALSKMDFLGLGRGMLKGRMRDKGVDDLETLIESARKAGVRLVACQMTMDLMGIAREELVDGVEIGGVATYMEAAGGSDVNLFI